MAGIEALLDHRVLPDVDPASPRIRSLENYYDVTTANGFKSLGALDLVLTVLFLIGWAAGRSGR
jgi:hypothetical protein